MGDKMINDNFSVDQIDHVELFVPDREEAAKWYERILGLKIIEEFRHWAVPKGPLMISTPNAQTKLALFIGEPRGSKPTAGFHITAFRVNGERFLQFLDRLKNFQVFSENGNQLTKSDARDHGKAYSIYFNDPWGHRLEITTYDYEFVNKVLKR